MRSKLLSQENSQGKVIYKRFSEIFEKTKTYIKLLNELQLCGLIPTKEFLEKIKFDPNYVEAEETELEQSQVMETKEDMNKKEIPHQLDSLIVKAKEIIQKWKRNLKQLYTFYVGKKSEKKNLQTSQESSSNCEVTLEESELNKIIQKVKASYKCLKSRYKKLKKVKTPFKSKDESENHVIETIGLYEYLLSSHGKKHEKVFTHKMEPLQKQRIQKVKETLEKVKNLKRICPKLLTLPSVLDIGFDLGLPSKIQTLIDKFEDSDISIDEVIRYYRQLHPSLQGLDQERILFVE